MADCLPSPVKQIGKCIWDCFLKPHVDYWWCFDDNFQQLNDGIVKLKWKIEDIESAWLLTPIRPDKVEKWLNDSTKKLEEARRILPDGNIPGNIPKWDIRSRYSLGKNAKETAEEITKLLKEEDLIQKVHPAPSAAMASPPHRSTTNFESRKGIEEDIIKSLKDSSVDMIGICGMGGIGKTTMAQRIWERVQDENLFQEVVMVTVSQKIDMSKIQNEIADLLKLKFNESSMSARAHQLRTRLMDKMKKLVILDDVWESLEFQDLGIPIDSNFERCKVLLTSRVRDTFNTITNKKVFKLETLKTDEAWNLFREKAGECIEHSALLSVATDVVQECKGLPIALVTVGVTLQGETDINTWQNSLSQLKKSNPTDLPKVIGKVYQPLKLSYDNLDTHVDQCFFLLCSLFPEDYHIPVEQLTWYSMGLQMFGDISSIKEATYKAHTLVRKLKERFLLIDGSDKLHVKMHDVTRDVAIYILKSLTSIKNSSDVNCNWMSVDISNEQMEVPVLSRFPKLQLLMWSSYDISHLSFEGMEDLKVLSFESISIGSLSTTLGSLKNLQTLRLVWCQVENISVIGKLTSLKILSCYGCLNITELPAEIGSLSGLRLLELSGCHLLQTIPFGVISSLPRLEELKMRRSFSRWEAEEKGKERRNASLTELGSLPNLSCLEIEIDDCTLCAQEIRLSQNLVKYYIRIGSCNDHYYFFKEIGYKKVMSLNLPSDIGAVGKWIQERVRNTESLHLEGDGCGSASNNFNIAEIEYLRNLRVSKCSTVKKLDMVFCSLDTLILSELENLEEICQRTIIPNQNVSLCNIKSIEIKSCPKLRYLFSVSVARTSLLQLEFLKIEFCYSMEEVFWNEGRDDNTDGCIEFPKLKELTLGHLPNLTAFCQGLENKSIKFPNLTHMWIGELPKLNSLSPLNSETLVAHDQNTCLHFVCNPKVEMSCLKDLTLCMFNSRNIWCHQISNNVFNNLETLNIFSINCIRSLMSTSIAKNLMSLKCLNIFDCGMLVEVIERDEDDDKQVVDINCLFPTLTQLTMQRLPKLKKFWQWNHALELPLLEYVRINNCPIIETFTLGFINTPNIKKIEVNYHGERDQIDLNNFLRHIWTENQDKCKAYEDWNEDENENENKD